MGPVVKSARWFIANTQTLPLAQDSKIARFGETRYFRKLWVYPGLIIPIQPSIWLRYDKISFVRDTSMLKFQLSHLHLFLSLYYRYNHLGFFIPNSYALPFSEPMVDRLDAYLFTDKQPLHPGSYHPNKFLFDGQFDFSQGSMPSLFIDKNISNHRIVPLFINNHDYQAN